MGWHTPEQSLEYEGGDQDPPCCSSTIIGRRVLNKTLFRALMRVSSVPEIWRIDEFYNVVSGVNVHNNVVIACQSSKLL